MAKMLLNQKHPQTCGYACRCGDDRYPGMSKVTKRNLKKSIRATEKRSWTRDINKEY